MGAEIPVGIAAIVALGIGAQWLAHVLGLPSILLLLAAGVAAGPWLGIVEPDEIFGDALFPVVSLGVGLLLFDGGLKLDFDRLAGGARRSVIQLLTVGVLVTAVGAAVGARLVLDVPIDQAAVLGAILIVSGPTVVGPILRLARPREPIGSILTFEGIFIDAIGATIAVAVLNVALSDGTVQLPATILIGIGSGLVTALVLVGALRALLIPDDLEVAVAFALAVVAFTFAEEMVDEAGLFATTAMGVALANQRVVSIERVADFGRTLGAVVLGVLFVVLAARVDLGDVEALLDEIAILTLVLVLVVRPLAAGLATAGTRNTWRARALVAGMAPKGVVAAATSSLFLIKFEADGEPFPELVPVTFGVIFATALVYGLGAAPLTRVLRLAQPPRRGVALVAEQDWALDLARCLARERVPVVLLPQGRPDAQLPAGVRVVPGPIRGTAQRDAMEDVGRAIVATESPERRQFAGSLLSDHLGRINVRELASPDSDEEALRIVFPLRSGHKDFVRHSGEIEDAYEKGARFEAVERVPRGVRPLLLIDDRGFVHLRRVPRRARRGGRLVALVRPGAGSAPPAGEL